MLGFRCVSCLNRVWFIAFTFFSLFKCPFFFKPCIPDNEFSNIITLLELHVNFALWVCLIRCTVNDSKNMSSWTFLSHKFFFPSTFHYSYKKKCFLKYASWTDILLLFWMSHCLSVHGRGDFEWCWMFYDSLLLCQSSPELLWNSDRRTSLPLPDLTA